MKRSAAKCHSGTGARHGIGCTAGQTAEVRHIITATHTLPRKNRVLQSIHVRCSSSNQRAPLRRCIVELHRECERNADKSETVVKRQAAAA